MFLGEVKARPIDIIISSLGHKSKGAIQTRDPSPSPSPLDTPAKPADLHSALAGTSPVRTQGASYANAVVSQFHSGITRLSLDRAVSESESSVEVRG